MSATLSINEKNVIIKIKGIHKILSFKSEIKIPLKQIVSVERYVDRGELSKGIRAGGINLPGIITAGIFYQGGEKTFWDVRNVDKSIMIKLNDNSFSKIIIEVNDQDKSIKEIQSSL